MEKKKRVAAPNSDFQQSDPERDKLKEVRAAGVSIDHSAIEYPLNPPGSLAMKVETPKPGECPYTLFIGAGASKSSAIPTAQDLIEEWKKEIFCNSREFLISQREIDDNEYRRWCKSEYPIFLDSLKKELKTHSEYRALFQYHYPSREERQIKIERIVDQKFPSLGYVYVAGLIVGRYFNRILTTNFDDLLNDSLRSYYDRADRPIVCAFDSAVSSFSQATQRPKVIKLHGDFLYDDMKNVETELKRLDENMEEKLKEMCHEFGLVVVGYGGEDESIMSPLREMLRSRDYLKKGLHWCLFCPRDEDQLRRTTITERELPERLRELIRDHRDQVHLYAIDSFDWLMEMIHARCEISLPSSLTEPTTSTPTQRFLDAYDRTTMGQKATPTMKRHRKEVLRIASQEDLSSLEYAILSADSEWEEGQTARDVTRSYDNALEAFTRSLRIIDGALVSPDKLDLQLLLRAHGRRAGALIGIAKVNQLNNESEWGSYVRDALSSTAAAVKVFWDREVDLKDELRPKVEERVASIYFNGCCAYGVLNRYDCEFDEKDMSTVTSYLKALRNGFKSQSGVYAGKEKIEKLRQDSDFSSLAYLLDDG